MEKKVLRKITRPVAKDEWIQRAKLDKTLKYMVDVHMEDDVLVLDFFRGNKLADGSMDASFRVFASDDDYLTQDMSTDKTKWLSGNIEYRTGSSYWSYYDKPESQRYFDIQFTTDEARKLVADAYGDSDNPIQGFIKFQENVAKERLNERHRRELEHTNMMMELVPDEPEDFRDWCYEYAMMEHRYLIYDASTAKRYRNAYCTHCRSFVKMDTKAEPAKVGGRGTCPNCGSGVTLASYKRWHGTEMAEKDAALLQRAGGYVIARYFRIHLYFEKGSLELLNGFERRTTVTEGLRAFYTEEGGGIPAESYEYRQYKTMKGMTWCPDEDLNRFGKAVVYTGNLPDALAGTQYRYSALDLYQKNEGIRPIPVWDYMKSFPKHPELEYMIKTGLTSLCSSIISGPFVWRYGVKTGIDVSQIRVLSKENMKILRRLNGNMQVFLLLKEFQEWGISVTEEEAREFLSVFGTRRDTIQKIALIDVHPKKLARYVRKQHLKRHNGICRMTDANRIEECKNICRDWEDYIGWCQELQYDIRDDYVLFPPDLLRAHDRLFAEKKENEDRIKKMKQERNAVLIKKIMEENSNIEPLHMKTGKFMIVMPSGVSDLKTEGETLHHCVRTYADRVAEGQTLILFVRKCEAPNTPFYTMEYKNGHVEQCRGFRNCDMTNDVKNFVKAFEKSMQEYEMKCAREKEVV